VAVRAGSTEAYGDPIIVATRARGGPSRPQPSVLSEAALAYTEPDPPGHPVPRRLPVLRRHLPVPPEQDGRAPGRFVGFENYAELFRDEVFLRTAWNSAVYTVVGVGLKFVIGLTMALILDQERRFNNFFRTLLFVPWAVRS
jgi:ABC-type sugar transport system permease subunit